MKKEKLTVNLLIESINMLEAQGRGNETTELRQAVQDRLDALRRARRTEKLVQDVKNA